MIKNWILTTVLIIFCVQSSKSQESISQKTSYIHKVFQTDADTTFIIQKIDRVIPLPNCFILSKKGKQITIYYYGDVTRSIRVSNGISAAVRKINDKGQKIDLFERALFYPVAIAKEDALAFWQKVINRKPWNISDDTKNQFCSDPSIQVYDGEEIGLFLITKNEIKSLMFPSPDFFEEKCPGNEHRKAILKIQNTFKSYFKF